jgi:hypothetical protein
LKPFKFSNTPTFFSFKEPTIPEDYERIRDKQVAENQRVFEALGLNTIASEFNNNLQQSAQKKGGKQQTREHIMMIHHHPSISLVRMIKEIVLMMMTLNQLFSQILRCFF